MTQDVRQVLLDKIAEVEEQRARLTEPQQDQGSISFGKRVGDGTAMAVDRLNAVTAHDQLGVIAEEARRALALLEEGSYGRCEVCGADIPAGRLEVRPWSTRCVQHSGRP